VRQHIANVKLGEVGACHFLRHSMATHMHENGADIRFIRDTFGTLNLDSTAVPSTLQ